MDDLLEPFTRIDRSVLWRLHARYWEDRGVAAFSSGEVPSLGTSNWAAASGHARFYEALVAELVADGRLDDAGPVRVLEVGAGDGRFASSFLRALEEGSDASRALLVRTEYLLSDSAERTLDEALESPRLKRWATAGRVAPLRYDLDQPPPPPLASGAPVVLVVAGYVASVLPALHLQRDADDHWWALEVEVRETGEAAAAPAISYQWEPATLDACVADPRHGQAIRRAVDELGDATVIYPERYFDFLRQVGEVLAPGGVVVTTDCGESDTDGFAGRFTREVRRYGRSLAEAVGFPLFDTFAEAFGWQVARTDEPLHELHSALATPHALTPTVRAAFDRHLGSGLPMALMDARAAGAYAFDDGELRAALRWYLRCVELDPYDAEYRYRVGAAAVDLDRCPFAIEHLRVGWVEDLEARWDIAFELGRAHALVGESGEALRWYLRSQVQAPHPVTEANIAALQRELSPPGR